ncbi:MAG: aldose 1-epimerase [Bryobacterales bacterium]|nr:aldose 1-epimerase [Bryobacterales bacterium]
MFLIVVAAGFAAAATYTAERVEIEGVQLVRLADVSRGIEVLIAPSLGNNAWRMTVKGQDILWAPFSGPGSLKARPALGGNPFLAPWANRLDQDAFFANGKKYLLNPELGNLRRDQNGRPIHGLLVFSSAWELVGVEANEQVAETASRLEFYRYPDLMAQFPFAHVIWMTHRLRNGELEIETRIENLAREPMPLAIGFHTYYRVPDAPRDEWTVHVPARERVVLSPQLLPTGERQAAELPGALALAGLHLDDVFTGLVRDPTGKAHFWVRGRKQRISVLFGPKFHVGVVFAPKGRDFICFEPMTGVTNAFNLAHAGLYPELQIVPPGGQWQESFWIRPEGF